MLKEINMKLEKLERNADVQVDFVPGEDKDSVSNMVGQLTYDILTDADQKVPGGYYNPEPAYLAVQEILKIDPEINFEEEMIEFEHKGFSMYMRRFDIHIMEALTGYMNGLIPTRNIESLKTNLKLGENFESIRRFFSQFHQGHIIIQAQNDCVIIEAKIEKKEVTANG